MKYELNFYELNNVKKPLKLDLLMVVLILMSVVLTNSELSVFNAFLLFAISIYFTFRALSHWFENFSIVYMLFTASMGVIFFIGGVIALFNSPYTFTQSALNLPPPKPAHVYSVEELLVELKNSDKLKTCPGLVKTLAGNIEKLNDIIFVTHGGFLILHKDDTWSRHILGETGKFDMECHSSFLRENPRSKTLFTNFTTIDLIAHAGYWNLSWDSKEKVPVWINRGVGRHKINIYSMPALKTVAPTINRYSLIEADDRFGFAVPKRILKRNLRYSERTLTNSFVFWDKNGAPYLLTYSPLPPRKEQIVSGRSILLMLQQHIKSNPWHPVVYLNPRTLKYHTPLAHVELFGDNIKLINEYKVVYIQLDPKTNYYYMVVRMNNDLNTSDEWVKASSSLNEHLHLTQAGDIVKMHVNDNTAYSFEHLRWGAPSNLK